jgi:hypothetical protein
MAFDMKSVGIGTTVAVAVTALGRAELTVFSPAHFLAQVPILVSAALVFRRLRAGHRIPLTGAAPQESCPGRSSLPS